MLDNIPNCHLVPRIKGASSELTTLSFLEAIQKGDIIEAAIEEDGSVWGTDINNLDPNYLYIYNYSPESIACLKTCSKINFLTVEIYTTDRIRLKRAMDTDWQEWESLEDFFNKIIKDSHKNNCRIDDIDCFIHYNHYKIKPEKFVQQIKQYNNKYHILPNLDNFIK